MKAKQLCSASHTGAARVCLPANATAFEAFLSHAAGHTRFPPQAKNQLEINDFLAGNIQGQKKKHSLPNHCLKINNSPLQKPRRVNPRLLR